MANQYVNKVDLADGTTLIDISSDTVAADKLLAGYTAHASDGSSITGNIATKTSSDMTASGKTVTAPAGYYASDSSLSVNTGTFYVSLQSHSITTTPVVTGALSGTITNIGTTTQPSGTDGTDYWTITPGGTVTTTGVSTARGKVTFSSSGWFSSGSTSSGKDTVDITPTVSGGESRYITKGAVTNNTSGGTSSGTVNRGSQIKIGAGYYPSDVYYQAQSNSGTLSISTYGLISVDGYENVLVANPATLVYTVGSFWATEDSTKNPATELGFGTWTKVSPIEATWNRLKQTTTWAEMAMDAPTIYVWKRTA